MSELLENSGFQEFTPELLKTQEGVNILNSLLKQLVVSSPSDFESVRIFKGYGSPEGVVTAGVSSLYMRLDGSAGTTTYQKQSGTGNTGWVAVPGGTGSFSLTVEEQDGTPSVADVIKIKIPNGNLTDDGSGVISIAFGTGDVAGPGSATDNNLAAFDGTTGKLIKDSGVLTSNVVQLTATQTLTNKRINPRVVTLTDAATITPDVDTTDIGVLTSLSQNSTFANPTGTPVTGQGLILRITSSTSRSLTFGSSYAESTTLILPVATTGSGTEDYIGFRYNSTSSKWVIVASTIGLLGDFTSDVSVSVDGEVVLFSGTTGKRGKRANVTGYAKLTSGVLSSQSTPIPVGDGGSGAATLTGILIGNGTSAFTTVTAPSGTVVGTSDTQSLTNKTISSSRINPRVVAASDATSITPTGDTADITHQTNTQSTGTLTINAPTGTPVDGQKIIIRIKSTNAQTFSWNSIYRAISAMSLPTVTTAGDVTDAVGFMYNSTDTKWDMLASTL